jgi:hypothetical protein
MKTIAVTAAPLGSLARQSGDRPFFGYPLKQPWAGFTVTSRSVAAEAAPTKLGWLQAMDMLGIGTVCFLLKPASKYLQ